jgi:hypothetical protein
MGARTLSTPDVIRHIELLAAMMAVALGGRCLEAQGACI